jgi:hypothetical protein
MIKLAQEYVSAKIEAKSILAAEFFKIEKEKECMAMKSDAKTMKAEMKQKNEQQRLKD